MIKGILLDVGGVVYVGNEPLPGAIDAVARLKAAGLPIRYITNATRTPRRAMLEKLHRLGVPAGEDEMFMPAIAGRRYLEERGLAPHLLIHPALHEDFAGLPEGEAGAVVVGDAAEGFSYQALNAAFRVLQGGAEFLALARNRIFQDSDGALSLDTGAFVAALEYATGREAVLFDKPASAFFAAAVDTLGSAPGEVVMIGDDAEADVAGAMVVGLIGLLVKTGKYRPGDAARIEPPPDVVLDDLSDAVEWILDHRSS